MLFAGDTGGELNNVEDEVGEVGVGSCGEQRCCC